MIFNFFYKIDLKKNTLHNKVHYKLIPYIIKFATINNICEYIDVVLGNGNKNKKYIKIKWEIIANNFKNILYLILNIGKYSISLLFVTSKHPIKHTIIIWMYKEDLDSVIK